MNNFRASAVMLITRTTAILITNNNLEKNEKKNDSEIKVFL